MHFKLAILTALSRRSDGRATLDDIRREVEALTAANEDRGEEQPQPLADIDIFQSGLVVPEGDELQITKSVVRSCMRWERSSKRIFHPFHHQARNR